MPLRLWECTVCGHQLQSKKDGNQHCDHIMTQVITAPLTKFMEKTDADRGKSAMVDQQKTLKERARKHSREVDTHDLIQGNERELAIKNGWINGNGEKRKAIDDL